MSLDYLNYNENYNNNFNNNNLRLDSNLVDPKIKFFFNKTLRKCHDFKNKHNTLISNIIYFSIFVIIIGLILLCKYKGKKKRNEKKK